MWGQNAAFKVAEDLAKKKYGNDPRTTSGSSKAGSGSAVGTPKLNAKKGTKPDSLSLFRIDGDNSVASSVTDTCNEKSFKSDSEISAQVMLESIKQAIEEQKKREEELNAAIKEQVLMARARKQSGNEMGAILCMKKLKRFQHERNNVTSAIDVLDDHLIDITSVLSKKRTLKSLDRDVTEVTVDLSDHRAYIAEVELILSQERPSIEYDGAKLLEELEMLPF